MQRWKNLKNGNYELKKLVNIAHERIDCRIAFSDYFYSNRGVPAELDAKLSVSTTMAHVYA
jgi:hypothetical protein